MRKKYVVYILLEKDVVEEVSFFTKLESKTTYNNVMLDPVVEFNSYDDAEIWVRRNGEELNEYTILEVFRKD